MEDEVVKFTLLHAKFLNGLTEFTKPRTWTLFQTIQRLLKTTNPPYLPLSNKPWRLLHIHLLMKLIISGSQGNKKPNRFNLSNRGKSFGIVHAIGLGILFSNKASFQPSNGSIRINLHYEHPTTTNDFIPNR